MTKTYRIKKNIAFFLSMLCNIGPLVAFVIMGMIEGEDREKVCLTLTAISSIVLGLICVMRKVHLRSTLYILMIGLWIALDNLLTFIVTLMICTLLDELILTPLYHRWKEDFHTNKQFDKRIGEINNGTNNIRK